MPEFILNHGSPFAAKQFGELDTFTQGYIEAMFFTNTGSGDDEELEHATVADLAPETLATIVGDCEAFQLQAAKWLAKAYASEQPSYDKMQAGRDFWFTRCGHGVGFWDRGLNAIGDELSEIAGQFGNRDLYAGDDGKLYLQ
jgi:hypothetical protein